MSEKTRVCVVTGVGPGNGASFSRRFAAAGYRVAMLARSEERLRELEAKIPGAKGYATDVGDAHAVGKTFARVRADLGPVDVLVHNAGSGSFGSFLDTKPDSFEQAWRINALGLLLCGQEAVKDMLNAGRGAVIVIGATASLRGGAGTAAFAPAKAAQRSLAQSMARSLGPQGIHVGEVVVDGVIDMPRTRQLLRARPADFFLKPDEIADTVYHLVEQDRSAWTFELDLRPYGEKF
ncbi:MAG: SDR family NAD(P)-dependent oxidoreductase [Deltaproteobacteria bacterium]|nr:SDR family NAD(P)-dependent oxidoreductase [Deltaproteobacteria bacterium]